MRLIRKHGSNPKFYFLEISLEFFDLFLLQKKTIPGHFIQINAKDTSEHLRTPMDTSGHL